MLKDPFSMRAQLHTWEGILDQELDASERQHLNPFILVCQFQDASFRESTFPNTAIHRYKKSPTCYEFNGDS